MGWVGKAGENLNLPVVGPLLRRGGAVFIKRSWGDDPLYPTVAKFVPYLPYPLLCIGFFEHDESCFDN